MLPAGRQDVSEQNVNTDGDVMLVLDNMQRSKVLQPDETTLALFSSLGGD